MILLLLLTSCAAVHLPPYTRGEDAAALLSRAVAPDSPEYAPWRTWGPCLALYGAGPLLPTTVRCGPLWGSVQDVDDVVELLRDRP